jgi:hypothetical protein
LNTKRKPNSPPSWVIDPYTWYQSLVAHFGS